MSRVVLDTNILISHLFGGRPREVVTLWSTGQVTLCVSPDILEEYREVLGRFEETSAEAQQLAAALAARANVLLVSPGERFEAVEADPDDNMFLDCAVAAQADVIVSGDQHLLELGEFRGIPIVGPAEFLARLQV
ncbi:MAG: putative toxin-antitoxin system toxin component, PIN family [Armatimonadota bacterium]